MSTGPLEPLNTMHANSPQRHHAFTLIEALIATALVLLLGIAVVQVFTVTSDTVAAGTALSEISRNHKAVREVLARDFTGTDATGNEEQLRATGIMDTAEMPYLNIVSTRLFTFPNALEAEVDADYDVIATPSSGADRAARDQTILTADLTGSGTEVPLSSVLMSDRVYRSDTLTFFTRIDSRRQTGDAGFGNAGLTSNESFIHYGHLRLFNGDYTRINDSGAYTSPGVQGFSPSGRNTNNIYANQFVLGRMQILMFDPTVDSNDANTDPDALGGGQVYIRRTWQNPNDSFHKDGSTPALILSPFEWENVIPSDPDREQQVVRLDGLAEVPVVDVDGQPFRPDDARTDAAAVTAADYRERLLAVIPSRNEEWYRADVQSLDSIMGAPFGTIPYRFWANPYIPDFGAIANDELIFDADSMAQRHHVLSSGTAHFIVEYAGDFVTQQSDGTVVTTRNSSGNVIAAVPDGVIDFYISEEDLNGDGTIDETEKVRKVMFYGFPRDLNGDGVIVADGSSTDSGVQPTGDVLPLVDIARQRYQFERRHPAVSTSGSNWQRWNHNDIPAENVDYGSIGNPVLFNGFYQAAWSPYDFGDYTTGATFDNPSTASFEGIELPYRLRPALIRIVIGLKDPNGRLDGTVYQEHVFRVRGPANFEPAN